MGWEAIERYELEKQEIEQIEGEQFDQEVPELVDFLMDESETMLMDESSQLKGETDFLTEELSFSTLAPVQFTKTTDDGTESPVHSPLRNGSPEQSREYTDLDRTSINSSQDMSFYDDFAKHGLQNATAKSDYCYTQVTSEQIEFDRLELEVIFRDQMEEIQTVCQALGMLPDPTYWSPENVRQWILWQCDRYNLSQPNFEYFYLTGLQLCQLTEDDFKMCAPDHASGTNLFWRLFNWRTVVEQMQTDLKPQLQHIPVPTCFPCSPGSLSPTSSLTDDDTDRESLTGSTDMESCIAKAREEDWLPEEPIHHHRQTIQLWQFLKQLLLQPALYSDCIKWVDRAKGIFKIENSTRVAKLWGKRKNRPAMNYDKLSRSIRQYYKKKIITKPVITKRLVYQFCKEYL